MAYDSVNVTPNSTTSLAAGIAQGAQNFYTAYQTGVRQQQYYQMMQQQQQNENSLRQLQMQKLQQEINPVQVDIQKLSMLSRLSDANPEYASLAKKQVERLFDGLDSPTKLSYANSVLSQHLAGQQNQPDYTKGSEQDPNFMGPKTPTVIGSTPTQLPGPVQPGQAPLSYDKPVMGYPPQGAQTSLPQNTKNDMGWGPNYADTGYRYQPGPPQPGQPYQVGDGGYRPTYAPKGAAAQGAKDDPSQGVAYEDLSPAYQAAMGGKVSLNPYEQKLLEKMISDRTANNIAIGRNATQLQLGNMKNMSNEDIKTMMAQYQDEWNRRNNDTRRENNINSNSTRADIADANNDSREKIAQGHDATSRANQKMRSGNKAGGAQNLDEKSINKQIETLNKQMGDLRKPNSMTGMVPPDDMIRSSEQWYQSQIQALEQKKSQLKGGGSQASGLPVRAVSKQDVANAPEGALIQWSGAGIPQGMYKKQGGHLVPAN